MRSKKVIYTILIFSLLTILGVIKFYPSFLQEKKYTITSLESLHLSETERQLEELEIDQFHPRTFSQVTSHELCDLFFEGLTRINPNGEVELALATNIEISSDQTTYIFTLNPTYWSNGDLLTAADLEESWKDVLLPSNSLSAPDAFFHIRNAKSASNGLIPMDIVGIWAKDPATLVVRLEEPNPFFLGLITHSAFYPMHPSSRSQHHPYYEKDKRFISNGPYTLITNNKNRSLKIEKNPNYKTIAKEWSSSQYSTLK
jgi:ABC-type oligopeptide transport system substrate-binding subunit